MFAAVVAVVTQSSTAGQSEFKFCEHGLIEAGQLGDASRHNVHTQYTLH